MTKHPDGAPLRSLCMGAGTPTRTVPDPTEGDCRSTLSPPGMTPRRTRRFGEPVAAAKARDALAPVTLVVPDGRTGVTARRAWPAGSVRQAGPGSQR